MRVINTNRRMQGGREEGGGKGWKEKRSRKVSVLGPCGIRPPWRAHDSRNSLRLGIRACPLSAQVNLSTVSFRETGGPEIDEE